MKKIVLVAVACSLMGAFAVTKSAEKKEALSPEARREAALKRTGGRIEKPGTQKGTFHIINTQKILPRSEIESVARYIETALLIKVEVLDKEEGAPADLLSGSTGKIGVVVVADDATPSLLVAPEDFWAVVNVKKLDKGFQTEAARKKFFAARCRRAVIRAFSCACGAIRSTYPGNMMASDDVTDLETYREELPNDKVLAAQHVLRRKGYAPRRITTYAKACREGWAPTPTNKYQKAVWDRYHTIPTKGIEIKYDPKKGR